MDAWDDLDNVGVGGSHVTASLSSPLQGDYNVGLHFLLGNLNAGDSRSLCFIYVAGDSLAELERNFDDAGTYAELICGKKVVGGVVEVPLLTPIMVAVGLMLVTIAIYKRIRIYG